MAAVLRANDGNRTRIPRTDGREVAFSASPSPAETHYLTSRWRGSISPRRVPVLLRSGNSVTTHLSGSESAPGAVVGSWRLWTDQTWKEQPSPTNKKGPIRLEPDLDSFVNSIHYRG